MGLEPHTKVKLECDKFASLVEQYSCLKQTLGIAHARVAPDTPAQSQALAHINIWLCRSVGNLLSYSDCGV